MIGVWRLVLKLQKLQRDVELYVKLKFVFEKMEVEVVKMEVYVLKNGS